MVGGDEHSKKLNIQIELLEDICPVIIWTNKSQDNYIPTLAAHLPFGLEVLFCFVSKKISGEYFFPQYHFQNRTC